MNISANTVKELREKTGLGMMECKNALAESGGDLEKAIEILRKKGIAKAARKAGRATGQGLVGSYIHHGGKVGVLIEVNCETDFVARTEIFQALVKDLAMHVAAANPLYIDRDGIAPEVTAKEREIYREQAAGTGKPQQVLDRIVEGKLEKFYQEVCLLEQPYIKDEQGKSVRDYVNSVIAVLGENIQVRRFQRFQLGESA